MSPHERRRHDRQLLRRLLVALVVVLVILLVLDRTGDDRDGRVDAAPPLGPGPTSTTGSLPIGSTSVTSISTSSALGGLTAPPIGDLFEIRTCTGEAVFDVIGLERFRAAGVSVSDVALAPNLAAVGIVATEADLTALASRFETCRTIKIIAEGHVRGLRVPVADAALTCVGDAAQVQPRSGRAAAELLAGTATGPYEVAMSAALQTCPDTVVGLMITVLETERSLSSSQRDCVRRETIARLPEISDAIATLDDGMGRFFYLVGSACP